MLVNQIGKNGGNILVISNLDFSYPEKDIVKNKMKFIRLSSPDNSACKIVEMLINSFGKYYKKIIKYSSFIEDLLPICEMCLRQSIKIYKGNSKFKIFTVNYPEIHAEIKKNALINVLNVWTSTNYQTQAIYIVSPDAANTLYGVLEQDVYKDTYSLLGAYEIAKMIIMNEPNAEWHNTFIIAVHVEDYMNVCEMLLKKLST